MATFVRAIYSLFQWRITEYMMMQLSYMLAARNKLVLMYLLYSLAHKSAFFPSIYTSKNLHKGLGGICVSLCTVNYRMWLHAFSHVETMQAFFSLCLWPSGNSLCSQALIIHDAGYQWPIFPAIHHGIGFLCVLWGALTLPLENTFYKVKGEWDFALLLGFPLMMIHLLCI